MASDARNIKVLGAVLKIAAANADPSSGTDLGYTTDGCTLTISRDVSPIQPDETYMPVDAVATKLSCEVSAELAEYDATQLAKIFPAIGAEPTYFSLSVSGLLSSDATKDIEFEFQKCYCPEAAVKVWRGGAWVFPFKAVALLNSSGAYPTMETDITNT